MAVITSFTANLGLIEPVPGDPATEDSWGTLLNTNDALLDSAVAGLIPLDVSGNTNVILTSVSGAPDQSRNSAFALIGVLTGNIFVLWPNGKSRGPFCVSNGTSGNFTVTCAVNNGSGAPAGSGYIVPQSKRALLGSDGVTVYAMQTDFSGLVTVTTFNTRTGAVTLSSADVTTALGFTPASAAAVVSSFNGRSGAVSLTSGDVTGALTYVPLPNQVVVNFFNGRAGTVTLSSGDVTGALGYTPLPNQSVVNTFNSRGGAVSLTSGDVTGALTFAPAPQTSLNTTNTNLANAIVQFNSNFAGMTTYGGFLSSVLQEYNSGSFNPSPGSSYSGATVGGFAGTWLCTGTIALQAPFVAALFIRTS